MGNEGVRDGKKSQEDLKTARFAPLFQAGLPCSYNAAQGLGARGVGQNLIQFLAIRVPSWEGGDLDSLLPAVLMHFA